MKNEAPYILEWVAHHLVIGFDHIVVLTNDCTDTTNAILTRLDALGYVTFQPNKKGPAECIARRSGARSAWMWCAMPNGFMSPMPMNSSISIAATIRLMR
jgi:hypothetical protein